MKPTPKPPSHARLVYSDGRGLTYGSAVPWKDGMLTVQHANVVPGILVRCEGQELPVKSVHRIVVEKISPGIGLENRSGDLVYLEMREPFGLSVIRAVLAKSATGKIWATHKDGSRSVRTVLNKLAMARYYGSSLNLPPDYLNPRWLILEKAPSARNLVPGDSGGAILNKSFQLVSLVSRVAGGQGPNLCHRDIKPLLP